MLGGSRVWFSVLCVVAAAKLALKTVNRHRLPEIHTEQLEAGSALVIRHLPTGRRR